MARERPSTWPKTTSQRVGWTARLNSSVGSRRSFCSSAWATARACPAQARGPAIRATSAVSTEAMGGAADAAGIPVPSSRLDGKAGEMDEHVVERRAGSQGGLELGGGAGGGEPALVEEGDLLADLVGLVHGMGGQEDRGVELVLELAQLVEHRLAGHRI